MEIGQPVLIKIKDNVIVDNITEEYDFFLESKIIQKQNLQYLILVSNDIIGSWPIDVNQANKYEISSDYLDQAAIFVKREKLIVTENKPSNIKYEGQNCKICKEFSPMSAPNQVDGGFICYTCRTNPLRKYY